MIFAGAGLSKRYLGAPSWIELLDSICKLNPEIEHSLAYYRQKYGSLLDVGEELIPAFHSWAWAEGRANFDDALFDPDTSQCDFLKFFVAKFLIDALPEGFEGLQPIDLVDETVAARKDDAPAAGQAAITNIAAVTPFSGAGGLIQTTSG